MFAPVLVTPPADTPVSIEEAKAHLRVSHDDDDTTITMQIDAATQYLDGFTGILRRGLVTQTWEQEFSAFETCMRLPLAPVSAVSSITYTDSAGDNQTLAVSEYEQLTDEVGPYVSIDNPPSTDDGRIKITFDVGYGDAADVPATIKAAILLHVGSLYEVREREIIGASWTETTTYKSLIAPYRRWSI